MRRLSKQMVKQAVRRWIGEPYVGKRLKLRWLSHRLPPMTPTAILDFGAEDATFSYWLADRYPQAKITAVDIDETIIDAVRGAQPAVTLDQVSFVAGDVSEQPAGAFDLVTALDVMEHIDDDRAMMRTLAERLRPGGRVIVHVPGRTYTDYRGRVHTGVDAEAWKVNPGHVRVGYTPDELRGLLENAGLEVEMLERWNRAPSAWAVAAYRRLEHPRVLRLLSLPITDVCAVLDRRRPASEGNTVFALARCR